MHLDADALSALRRALYGSYRLDIAEGVHLVSRALPDDCVAAASVVGVYQGSWTGTSS